jgi:glycosyltransferase involved in cell wall biosynthesis
MALRVVHLLGWYFPESLGGTEVYVRTLVARLRAAGHDVAVAAPERGGREPRTYLHEGALVFRYPLPLVLRRDEAQGETAVRGAEALCAWLSDFSPHVVHLHNLGVGLGLPEMRHARASGARLFVTFHSSGLGYTCLRGTLMREGRERCDGRVIPRRCAACALAQRGLPRPAAALLGGVPPTLSVWLGRWPGRWATALGMSGLVRRNQSRQAEVFGLAERVVVLTEAARQILVENGAPADKLVLHRLGTSHPVRRRPRPPAAAPVRFAYLGRFEPLKGVGDLIEAVRSLPPGLSLRLELRGPEQGGWLDDLRRRAAGDARIVFLPALAVGEVPAYLENVDVLCCPSRCLEGGPTVALEALAQGTPVIGSRLGGLGELIRDERRLVEPGDVRGWARLLERIARQPALLDSWRETLETPRTMDDVAADTLALYLAETSG